MELAKSNGWQPNAEFVNNITSETKDQQQSIDISCWPGPQQQTCSSGVRRPDGTDRQADGRRQLHKPCSTYFAGSVNKSQVFTLRSSNFSVKSMILANWWNSACCDSRCWRAVMSLEHSTLSRFGTVLSAQRAMTMTSIRISEAKYLYAHLSH